jgi:hypothetical protein
MTALTVSDDVVERLRRISEQARRSVDEVLRSMIDQYKAASRTSEARDPLDDFIGAFDDDVPDISSSVCKHNNPHDI